MAKRGKLENLISVNDRWRVVADSRHEACNSYCNASAATRISVQACQLKDGDIEIRLMTTCIL